MNQEILEILIGKHLDGEITPGEQRILEVELDRDPRAKELLAELRHLHERSSELVASCILGQGKTSADVFEQAWQQAEHPIRHRARRFSYAHVAVGVAGFLMGLAVHFVLPGTSTPQSDPAAADAFVQNVGGVIEFEGPALPDLPADPTGSPVRNVDWYSFSDKDGNQWLIEGLRENIVRPAAYYTDL
ncbi:MAG: anti-sigma factor family protein [Planctomycetota bacterium]|jgi:anti-sigma factor RsiW